MVSGPVSAGDSEATTASEPASQSAPPVYTSGQPVALLISARDQYGNLINHTGEYFQVILSGPQRVYASANTMYSGYYFANLTEVIQMAGVYSVAVSFSSLMLKDSPLQLSVVPDRVLPSACYASGIGSIYGVATQTTYFSLVAKDRFDNLIAGKDAGNKFEINLFAYAKRDDSNSPFVVSDEGCDGLYPCHRGSFLTSVTGTYDQMSSSAQYVAEMPATYVLSITYDGKYIKQSSSMSCCNSSICTSCVTVGYAPAPVAKDASFSDSGSLLALSLKKRDNSTKCCALRQVV